MSVLCANQFPSGLNGPYEMVMKVNEYQRKKRQGVNGCYVVAEVYCRTLQCHTHNPLRRKTYT